MIAFQDLFAMVGRALPPSAQMVWEFIYPVGAEVTLGAGGPHVTVLYTIVPWIGVMAAGYAFGPVMIREPGVRRRRCLQIGLSATLLFLVVATLSAVMQPSSAEAPPLLLRILNQRKYPASPLFLLMTLGPAIALLPAAERARGWFAQVLATFGRVPMFYYLAHIPLIHAVSLLVWEMRTGNAHTAAFATAPYVSIPPEQRWSLPLLYLVFGIVVATLYPLCRWYARVKSDRPRSWLRYI